MSSESEFVGHEACPECGSDDNLARYSDGHGYCFGCRHYEHAEGAETPQRRRPQMAEGLIEGGEHRPLKARGITQATCEHWNYEVGEFKGRKVQIANYYDGADIVAQKVRDADKNFKFLGEPKRAALYGQHLWRDRGKMVVVTEGEIDALTVSQLQGNKWPVVSVQNGAQGAAKSVRKAVEWLSGFERVVFMFDSDKPGREAAEECALLLPPGRAYIARLPEGIKDANEALVANRGAEVIDAIWSAKAYRPDGIVKGSDLSLDRLRSSVARGVEIPYPELNAALRGLRKRELLLMTAGSGIGKSTLAREIAYHLVKVHGNRIGNVFLEESVQKTAVASVAIDNNIPLGDLLEDPSMLDDEKWQRSHAELVAPQFYYDHFGSLESTDLMAKMNYMAVGEQCDFIVLDHISMVVSGQEGSGEGERKDIDRLMTNLRSMIERTGVGVIAIVHLKRPGGGRASYNEGGRVSLQDLRGSGSLEQLSDNIIALERDQQDQDNPDLSQIRLLKNRQFGDLGLKDYLLYHRDTGRLLVAEAPPPRESREEDTTDF